MGKRNKNKKPSTPRAFDGPAKTGEGTVHVIERFNEGSTGQKKRFRNVGEHPLTLAWKRGALGSTDRQNSAHYDAGNTFRKLFENMGKTGLDSTQTIDRSRSGGNQAPFTQTQVDAIKQIQNIQRSMPSTSYSIVRNFCGEGRSMRESVALVILMHPNGIRDRIVEALHDLDIVLDALRIRKAA